MSLASAEHCAHAGGGNTAADAPRGPVPPEDARAGGRHPTALAIAIGLAAALASTVATAQTYPSRPIRFVVPFPPSGGADIIVRALAQRLTERLGQTVVVDNRSGAGGNVGTEHVARSPADGYTLLLANVAPIAINVSVHRQLPYDPVKDFTPITLLATFPNVLVMHPSVPARSIPELVTFARARPGQLTFASAGVGSTTHLSGELFRAQAALDIVHVPYKGGGPALVDLLGGQVTMYFSSLPGALPHVRSGRLRALGVTSLKRAVGAPEIPTVAEAGFPGFEAVTWIGTAAPAGLARPIVERLHGEIGQIMRSPEMRERLVGLGAEVLTSTPEEFSAYIRSEIGKWAKVVRDAKIRAE